MFGSGYAANLAAMTVNGAKRTYRVGRWAFARVAGETPTAAMRSEAGSVV